MTPSGIVMLVRLVQPENAELPMLVSPEVPLKSKETFPLENLIASDILVISSLVIAPVILTVRLSPLCNAVIFSIVASVIVLSFQTA